MAQNIGAVLKTLRPLINQRLAQLEAGVVTPGSAAPIDAPWLARPNFTGGANTKNATVVLPNGQEMRYDNYRNLPQETKSLLSSVVRLKSQLPEQHHSSFLGHLWHDIEKPYHAVTGGLGQLEDFGKTPGANKWTLHNIGKSFEQLGVGLKKGWEGKSKYNSFTDILKTDPLTKHQPGKLKAVEGFVGDVALDPLSYAGVGKLTKVKSLARSAEDIKKAKEVETTLRAAGETAHADVAPHVLLGPKHLAEDSWFGKKQLLNSQQRTSVMRHAVDISKRYGDIVYTKTLNENFAKAAQQLEKQGIKRYESLTAFRKALKGDATAEDLSKWNRAVEGDIQSMGHKLTGSRVDFIEGKSQELLALATKNNLAGDAKAAAEQTQKAIALRYAGHNVFKVRIPKSVVEGSKSVVASEKMKGVREFSDAMHGYFNTVFRTGSHIDPFVNAMRMARGSSIIDKMNNHVINENSIWRSVNRKDRASVAENIANKRVGVTSYKGGHNLNTGEDVHDLVSHGVSEIEHLQGLVGKGKLVSERAFLKALPSNYRFGEDYFKDPNWLFKAWKEFYLGPNAAHHLQHIGKDPAVFLLTMRHAIYSAAANKELPYQIGQRFGHELYPVDELGNKVRGAKADPVVRTLKDKHGYRTPEWSPRPGVKQTIRGYEGRVFHPDVASGIEAIDKMLRHEGQINRGAANPGFIFFNKATQLFKSVVTKYNPGFHERNLLGEMASAAADGVISLGPYRKSLQVLRLHGRLSLDTGKSIATRKTFFGREVADSRVHNAIMPDAYRKARIAEIEGNDIIIKKRFNDLKSKGVTADQLWHAYVANGLKTGFITTEYGKTVSRFGGGGVGSAVNTKVQHLTENIEDYARLAHFVSRIERSRLRNFQAAAEEAAGFVRKFHFDYNDYTYTEKAVLSRIFPFYRWTRKNIPLQLTLLATHPAYFLTQMKALNAISQAQGFGFAGHNVDIPTAEDVMPSWLKEHLAVPVGMGSSGVRYLDAPLPTKDAFNFFGSSPNELLQNIMYMANPAIKDPMEVATGHQIGGAPIQTDRYLAGQTPYTSLLNNLLNKNNTGKQTNLLQFLLGSGLVENTPARIKSELKREQAALAATRKKYRASHGMLPLGNQ